MNGKICPSYFMGANTPGGFYSLFSGLYFPEDGWILYILKGGPGTGKSSFMKKISAEAESRGIYHEKILCSSDPASFDAVILPGLKISICDGTPPHVAEPRYPGVSEVLVDLGAFRDDMELRKNGEEIIRTTKECSLLHKRSTEAFRKASLVNDEMGKLMRPLLKTDELFSTAGSLAEALIGSRKGNKGEKSRRFLSAYTSAGYISLDGTFTDMCTDRVVLDDIYGFAAPVILERISSYASSSGLSFTECPDPMEPDEKTEHLIFPDLSLGIFTSGGRHKYEGGRKETVDCMEFYESFPSEEDRKRYEELEEKSGRLTEEGLSLLKEADAVHERLEKLYYPYMDFGRADIKEKEITDMIFG